MKHVIGRIGGAFYYARECESDRCPDTTLFGEERRFV